MNPSSEPDPDRPPPPSGWQEMLRDAGPYLGLGMQLGLSLVFFVGIGYLLDRWLGTTPWLLIGGSLVGMFAGFLYLVRVSTSMGSVRPKKPGPEAGKDAGSSPPTP